MNRSTKQILSAPLALALLLAAAFPLPGLGHPGPLDIQGGHSNKETGRYHLHQSGGITYRLPKQEPASAAFTARVLRVLEGDRLRLMNNDRTFVIELAGIDAPEPDQPHGPAAKQYLESRIAGKNVRVQPLGPLMPEGTPAEIFTESGEALIPDLVEAGHAWVLPGPAAASRLQAAQSRARLERRGLWALPSPVPPWQWRDRTRP